MPTHPISKPVLPAIHLNGTGRDTLHSEYRAAWEAFRTAERLFRATTCHPRDFYVLDRPDQLTTPHFTRARHERDAILERFNEIREFLEAHVSHLTPEPLGARQP